MASSLISMFSYPYSSSVLTYLCSNQALSATTGITGAPTKYKDWTVAYNHYVDAFLWGHLSLHNMPRFLLWQVNNVSPRPFYSAHGQYSHRFVWLSKPCAEWPGYTLVWYTGETIWGVGGSGSRYNGAFGMNSSREKWLDTKHLIWPWFVALHLYNGSCPGSHLHIQHLICTLIQTST